MSNPTSSYTATTTTATTNAAPTADESLTRCNVRGCRVRGAEKLTCAADGCNKMAHLMCYQALVLTDKKNNTSLPPLPNLEVACTKACYTAATKALSSNNGRGNWTTDGIHGPEDPHTSMKILLDFLTTEGNYSRFCGKDNNGVTKQQFGSTLAEKICALQSFLILC